MKNLMVRFFCDSGIKYFEIIIGIFYGVLCVFGLLVLFFRWVSLIKICCLVFSEIRIKFVDFLEKRKDNLFIVEV